MSTAFYQDVLGFRPIPPTIEGMRAAAFRAGAPTTSCCSSRSAPRHRPSPRGRHLSLYHFGLKVGDSDDELREARERVEAAGVPVVGAADHTVTHSLYVLDPDGNELELYIDVAGVDWRDHPDLVMAPVRPLEL